jgi:hypothetical protein
MLDATTSRNVRSKPESPPAPASAEPDGPGQHRNYPHPARADQQATHQVLEEVPDVKIM